MNLYQYHNNPNVLPGHNNKEELLGLYSLPYIFEKYIDQPDELKKRESFIAKSAEYSYRYANDVLCSRFHLGERVILTDAHIAFIYKRRFQSSFSSNSEKEQLENQISKYSELSYRYATEVLKARFPLGELAIKHATNSITQKYKKQFPDALT